MKPEVFPQELHTINQPSIGSQFYTIHNLGRIKTMVDNRTVNVISRNSLFQRWQCPINNGTPTLKYELAISMFIILKADFFQLCFLTWRKLRFVTTGKRLEIIKNKTPRKMTISSSLLSNKVFKGTIVNRALSSLQEWATWNYTHSPINITFWSVLFPFSNILG